MSVSQCTPVLQRRDDDTLEVIQKRFAEYDAKTEPMLSYYRQQRQLVSFEVKRGIKDTPDLLKAILADMPADEIRH